MNKLIPWCSLAIVVMWLAAGWRSESKSARGPDVAAFGHLPVLVGGRVKPFDTVARNSLLIINNKQEVRLEEGGRLGATRWLVDVLFNAEVADAYPVFLIQNPEVLSLLGVQQGKRKRFTYREIKPFLSVIEDEGRKAGDLEAAQRTPYQTAVLNVRNALVLYQHLQRCMQPGGTTGLVAELEEFGEIITGPAEREERDAYPSFIARYESLAADDYVRPVPPVSEEARETGEWQSIGGSLVAASTQGGIHPVTIAYARIGDAHRAGDVDAFNKEVGALSRLMASDEAPTMKRVGFEHLFNYLEPFYRSMGLYVLAGLLGCASWLLGPWSAPLRRSAVLVLLVALVIHTFGLGARMSLQGRPPVTNLYSSAVFIGWATVLIGLLLERFYKDGIGAVSASGIGFVTLIIAHHLAGSGDTLQMLQAVLDTNIWLATHVVVITAGYSAMFLAGALAIIYVIRGVFTRSLDKRVATSLERMVYGVICFATLFSFVGTVLGGIWADQSWGRFWGWDPKENGALLIVLCCAVILHARWGGYIRARGLMILALFGNIVTSFSWFGVNMLGVGLHSYGFMNKAFPWLIGFIICQVVLMAAAALPKDRWRSFRPVPPAELMEPHHGAL